MRTPWPPNFLHVEDSSLNNLNLEDYFSFNLINQQMAISKDQY